MLSLPIFCASQRSWLIRFLIVPEASCSPTTQRAPRTLPTNPAVSTFALTGPSVLYPPGYRGAARRIAEQVVKRFGEDPAVVAWQTDNELDRHGTIRCYCAHCERSFQEWLRARFGGDIQLLNRAWGTVFWSQEYNGFDEISPTRRCISSANRWS